MSPLIFISHSNRDSQTAEAIVRLLRSALNLDAKDLRCTSVDGYRLPAGAETDAQLRSEILDVKVLVGIISPHGMSSAYVLFELGARWGANRKLIPLLAPGVSADILRGPVTGLNALSCDSEAQLHQLVADIAQYLGQVVSSAAIYLADLRAVLALCGASVISEVAQEASEATDTQKPSLEARHIPVLRVFACSNKKYMSVEEVANQLGWKRVSVEYSIDVLSAAGHMDYDFLKLSSGGHRKVHMLTPKGRALSVEAGLID